MSRRYCSVCSHPHDNGAMGLCTIHLEEQENTQREINLARDTRFQAFMPLPESERWEHLFTMLESIAA